ncbi:IS982 family transposase, partial [Streptococcus anginosus]|nr:IS982 family transposase [Streptococcus anginosus]MDB8660115.1 IS982 family transposase [Streptococcus anginosus]
FVSLFVTIEQVFSKEWQTLATMRQNMEGASQHNNWRLLAMRRTIETRFSELCALFDMEHTFARGVAGLQLRIEQILLAYHLSYFELN